MLCGGTQNVTVHSIDFSKPQLLSSFLGATNNDFFEVLYCTKFKFIIDDWKNKTFHGKAVRSLHVPSYCVCHAVITKIGLTPWLASSHSMDIVQNIGMCYKYMLCSWLKHKTGRWCEQQYSFELNVYTCTSRLKYTYLHHYKNSWAYTQNFIHICVSFCLFFAFLYMCTYTLVHLKIYYQ